jgi:hypothetical protein
MSEKNTIQAALQERVNRIVLSTPVDDIHTHLYDPAFGPLLLWGIDELLVYHYLVAEGFRHIDTSFDSFWKLPTASQAELIWKHLFLEHSPISEACRGVVTTLHKFGLDVRQRDLSSIRKWFSQTTPEEHTTRCMDLARVKSICMTNSPFDPLERPLWERGFSRDSRFTAALRIDPLLINWEATAPQLVEWGYQVSGELGAKTISEAQRFLADWSKRIQAQYVMVSLPPHFEFPGNSPCAQLIEKAVIPFCRDHNLAFALMMGVKRAVNPGLRLAGDGVGRSNLAALQNLCAAFPENKFLATVLSRENQQELCVLARKFRNLHVFGCWWFTNIPSIIEEMTRMRLELIGLSCTPQHSDARVLDQIIYKWEHSRQIISKILAEKYADLELSGWEVTDADIQRDARLLFGGAYHDFFAKDLRSPVATAAQS